MPMQMQGTGAGMWRQGEILVVTRGLVFPDHCPVSNQSARTRYDYEFSYLSPEARAAGAMFGALGAAVANSMATKANYQIPHTDEYIGAYRSNLAIGLGALFGGIAVIIGGAFASNASEALAGTLIVLGIGMIIGGLIWLVAVRRELTVHYVSDTHCWIAGCSPEFLATLPPWPYEAK